MRLQSYINESLSDHQKNKLKKVLEDKCQPFLKEFGVNYAHGYFIYRGLKRRKVNSVDIIKARTDRKPRFIHKELHDYLNNISMKYFGWKTRSEGVFTADRRRSTEFGNYGVFIPIDKYEYITMRQPNVIYQLYDLYGNILDTKYSHLYDMYNLEDTKERIGEIYKHYHRNKKLPHFIKLEDFEAIFKCKEYLLINPDYVVDLMDILIEILGI